MRMDLIGNFIHPRPMAALLTLPWLIRAVRRSWLCSSLTKTNTMPFIKLCFYQWSILRANDCDQLMQNIKINFKVLLIFVLALVVRLLGMATRPIWYDEAFSILFSEKGISPMLYGTLAATGAGTAD